MSKGYIDYLLTALKDRLQAMVDNYDNPFMPEAEKAFEAARQLLKEIEGD